MIEFIIIAVFVLIFWNPVVLNTIGPFIIWKTQKIPTNVKFVSVNESNFINERNQDFKEYDLELSNLKFVSIGSSLLIDTQTESHFRLYWSEMLKMAAMVVTMKSKIEENTYLEFTQAYSDHTVLNINNSKQSPAYPELEFKKMFRFPEEKSAEKLLKYHASIKEKLKPSIDAVDYEVTDGFKGIEKHLKRESDELLRKGILKEEIDDSGNRAVTLCGAFAMTFRSVSPGKNIWGYINEKKSKRLVSNV